MDMDSRNHGEHTAGPLSKRNSKLPCGRLGLVHKRIDPIHHNAASATPLIVALDSWFSG